MSVTAAVITVVAEGTNQVIRQGPITMGRLSDGLLERYETGLQALGARAPAEEHARYLEIAGTYRKHSLPNYGVFDENRYFQRGASVSVYGLGEATIAVNISARSLLDQALPGKIQAMLEQQPGRTPQGQDDPFGETPEQRIRRHQQRRLELLDRREEYRQKAETFDQLLREFYP